MKLLLLLTLAVLTSGQETCHSPKVPTGVCSLYHDCIYLKTYKLLHATIDEFIHDFGGCGIRNGDLLLCCPVPQSIWSLVSGTSKRPPVTTSPSTPSTSSSVSGCGTTDFTDVPGVGCLKVILQLKTFDEASTHCSALDAQLVVTQNFQAFKDYVASLPPSRGYHWIGVRQNKWLDGRDVGPEEWAPADHRTGDGCGIIYRDSNGIADYSCDGTFSFICQLRYNAL